MVLRLSGSAHSHVHEVPSDQLSPHQPTSPKTEFQWASLPHTQMLFCSNLGISEASREAGYECIFSGLPSENPCQKATVGIRNLHFHQVPTPEMILKQVVHRLCSGKHPPLPYPIWLLQVWKLRSPWGQRLSRSHSVIPWHSQTEPELVPCGPGLAPPCCLGLSFVDWISCLSCMFPSLRFSHHWAGSCLQRVCPLKGPERAGAQRTPDRWGDVWNCSRTQIFSSFFFFLNSLSSLLFTRMCVCWVTSVVSDSLRSCGL